MNETTAINGFLGAGAGLGLVLIVLGLTKRTSTVRRGSGRGLRGRFPYRRTFAAITAAVLAGAVTRWPSGAILAAAGAWWLPRTIGADAGHTAQVARIEAIATWTEAIRDTVSAAAGLEQSLIATAPLAPAPIAEPVAELAAHLRSGDRLSRALYDLADALADPTADLVVAALVTAADQHARDLAGLLTELAKAARDQAAMRLRVAAARARTRSATRIITAATATMVIGLVVWSRDFLHPYGTVRGQLVLLLIGGIFAVAFTWLTRQARFPEPARLLTSAHGGTP